MDTFQQKVRDYVEKKKPKLYILTPCYGSMCYVNYMLSLIETIKVCNKFGIEIQPEFCRNDSLVPRARNNLIARAMNDPKMTHMMFIDADIIWDPIDVIKLVISNQLLVGGLYPLKHFNWDRIKDENVIKQWKENRDKSNYIKNISDETLIQNKLLRYNFNQVENTNTLKVSSNLTEVRHLATGFMMIRRETIDCMQQAFPSTKYIDDIGFLKGTENDHAFALFDCGVEVGHYFSEDWLFSQRWVNMGGKVMVDITINLTHTGIQDFRGSFLASLL